MESLALASVLGHAACGAHLFLVHLRDCGAAPPSSFVEKPGLPAPVEAFERWMRQHRGVFQSTLVTYRMVLVELLDAQGADPSCYEPTFRSLRIDAFTYSEAYDCLSTLQGVLLKVS